MKRMRIKKTQKRTEMMLRQSRNKKEAPSLKNPSASNNELNIIDVIDDILYLFDYALYSYHSLIDCFIILTLSLIA
jgi:hypothetical protein